MLKNAQVLKSLNELDRSFKNAKSNKDCLFAAKLAVIEACGWIEETTDELILKFVDKRIVDGNVSKKLIDAVSKNFGFDYENNIKLKVLVPLLGWNNINLLEGRLDPIRFSNLKSSLGNLKTSRDTLAHTYIRNTTPSVNSPSTTIVHFNHVLAGLRDFEKVLMKVKFKI